MALLWFILIGLAAGWLAGRLMRGSSFGAVGDIVVGVVGSFVGGFLFKWLHIAVPFHGIAGTILVAFVGAVVLLLLLRLVRSGARRRS